VDNAHLAVLLEEKIGKSVSEQGFELVELLCRQNQGSFTITALVDRREGGITLDECVSLNSLIGEFLEKEDLIPGSYILEVSSPGVDREFSKKKDFMRSLNCKIKFFLKEQVDGKIEWDGVLEQVKDNDLIVKAKQGYIVIPLEKVNKAKRIIE
jgi:ribosome maturation factor RimP